MKHLYLILFIFSCHTLFAQNPQVDSLKNVLASTKSDSLKAVIHGKIFGKFAFVDNDLALKHLDSAIAIAQRRKDNKSLGQFLNNKAVIYRTTSRQNLALDYLLKAATHSEKGKDSLNLLNIYGNMGAIFMDKKEYPKASSYYNRIMEIVDVDKNPTIYLRTLNNLGLVAMNSKKYEEATDYFNRAIAVAEKEGVFTDMALALNNIGLANFRQKKYDQAKEYYLKSLEVNQRLENKHQIIMNNLNLGESELEQKRFAMAIDYAEKALAMAEELDYLEEKGLANHILYRAYKGNGQLAKAFEHLEFYADQKQEFLQDLYDRDMAELQEVYESEVKEKQITDLKQKEELQAIMLAKKNIQVSLGGILLALALILLGVVYYLFSVKRKSAKELSEKNLRIETLIRELHHRVKNNLQIVNSLLSLQYNRVEDEGTKQAIKEGQSRLEAMALIHKNLYMEADFTGLDMKEYLDFLTKSLATSYGFPVEVVKNNIDLKDPVFDLDLAVPLGLIVNELASNAFKYAFENKEYAELVLEMKEKDSKIVFRMRDNGKGLPENFLPEKSTSFGLKLVTTLIRQLKGKLQTSQEQGLEYSFEFVRK